MHCLVSDVCLPTKSFFPGQFRVLESVLRQFFSAPKVRSSTGRAKVPAFVALRRSRDPRPELSALVFFHGFHVFTFFHVLMVARFFSYFSVFQIFILFRVGKCCRIKLWGILQHNIDAFAALSIRCRGRSLIVSSYTYTIFSISNF